MLGNKYVYNTKYVGKYKCLCGCSTMFFFHSNSLQIFPRIHHFNGWKLLPCCKSLSHAAKSRLFTFLVCVAGTL